MLDCDKNDYFEKETSTRSLGFVLIILLAAFMVLAMISIRIYGLNTSDVAPDPTLYVEPSWYNYIVIALGIDALFSLFLTYKFYKIGVYSTALSLFLMVVLNPDPDSLIHSLAPIFTLFVFLGYGLFEIIPRWKFFK